MAYIGRHAFLPSTRWRDARVHWHAYLQRDRNRANDIPGDRIQRLDRTPLAVVYTPDEVAQWIEDRTRELVDHRKVRAIRDAEWVEIGDTEDLKHLYTENVMIASRGDSIYTDIYSETEIVELFLEAVSAHDCSDH